MNLVFILQAVLFGVMLHVIAVKTKNLSLKKRIIISSICGFLYGYIFSVLQEQYAFFISLYN